MLTMQHTLTTLLTVHGNEELLKENIPYILLPDIIRKYTGDRQYSHFEMDPVSKQTAWMKFPEKLDDLTKEKMNTLPKSKPDFIPCVIGEETILREFIQTNKDLPDQYFKGVFLHLVQDKYYDAFTRDIIDCSKKYEDDFAIGEQHYNGKEIREKITDIEMDGIFYLAMEIYERYGITVNQKWFDENVKPALDRVLPAELAESGYSFMQLPEDLNRAITEHDVSLAYISNIASQKLYMNLYEDIMEDTYRLLIMNDHNRIFEEAMAISVELDPTPEENQISEEEVMELMQDFDLVD